MPRGWGRKYDFNGKPRKPCTAYNFYIQENYRYLRRAMRDRDPHRIIREAGNRWKYLERAQKVKYHDLAKQDKIRAAKEKEIYNEMVASGQIVPPMKRERITQQPGYPRSTTNSFLFYANFMRKQVSEKNRNMDSREVMQELGKMWRQMSRWDKLTFLRRRDQDKQRYRAAKKKFQAETKARQRAKREFDGRKRLIALFHANVSMPDKKLIGASEVAM